MSETDRTVFKEPTVNHSSKGEGTRKAILERAIEVFNVRGYSGTSLNDIMQATGLQKGGIYNHFASKEDLALEAFDHAFSQISDMMRDWLKGTRNGLERLRAIIQFFHNYFETPPFHGGCILLNTAIESDDAHPALCERAQHAMTLWRDLIRRTVEKGIGLGEIHATIDSDNVATLIISTLEGAMVLSRLYKNPVHLHRAVAHLLEYVENNLKV